MNFYNEHDKKAAQWLRELIKVGAIAPGVVDERSIEDIAPAELDQYTQVHFFAGIGGWPLAFRLAGWPDDRPVVSGSCPCQPFSVGGKGEGVSDERHLWPAFKWHLAQRRNSEVFGEQVASKLGRDWLTGVRLDLEDMGFEVGAADLCGASGPEDCELGILRGDSITWERGTLRSPHIRQRLWWLAVPKGLKRWREQQQGEQGSGGAGPSGGGQDGRMGHTQGEQQRGSRRRVSSDRRAGALGGSSHGSGEPAVGLADLSEQGLEKRGALGGAGKGQTLVGGGTSGGMADADSGPRPEHEHQPGRGARGTASEADSAVSGGNSSGVAEPVGKRRGKRRDHDRGHDRPVADANGDVGSPSEAPAKPQRNIAGWTTPQAHDAKGSRSPTQKDLHGTKHGCRCLALDAKLSGWSTPTAQDGNRSTHPPRDRDTGHPLDQQAVMAGWNTPHCPRENDSDHSASSYLDRQILGEASTLSPAPTEKRGALAPEFSRWLMGYPAVWGYCGAMAMQLFLRKPATSSSRTSKSKKKAPPSDEQS